MKINECHTVNVLLNLTEGAGQNAKKELVNIKNHRNSIENN